MSQARYIEAKQKWAEKQQARGFRPRAVASSDRLPPGQKLTTSFPVLDLGVQPEIPLAEWRLSVGGLVERPTTLTWDEFNALPQVEDTSDFHCVTTWSRYDCRWSGVAFTKLYELAQPKPEARFVYFTSFDGYSTNVPLAACLDDDVLVATRFDGAPLTREHGGPARVIIPKLYAWKGAKFVSSIAFLADDKPGFWELRGYSDTADPWKEERYQDPSSPPVPLFPNPEV
ncbi:sulfite oxidase-like oxidoreductase [Opitutus terrae]|uniref:Oxidoreductase molybdopterin binding n=1 Tax=Opitutus terrae (strain DSM 11246 / JCM 15787 / PB90-1) TaxID=452637 RepID=B1ZR05_OPITP|nr:sulfite oxidase-like oxidoreductase [Opitutus terrae]ACB73672.1 oxidoreductase molybdopterin binding [Opitutus terrae PB90-1]